MRTCPNCGHENADTDRFCSNCGTSLSNVTPTPSEPAPEPESTPPAAPEPKPTPTQEPAPPAAQTPPPTRPTSPIPPPVDFAPRQGTSVEDEWRMSSLGPPPPRRRIWLWILIGILAVCLLACVGLIGFSLTDTGQEWIEDLATEAAQQATEQAD